MWRAVSKRYPETNTLSRLTLLGVREATFVGVDGHQFCVFTE